MCSIQESFDKNDAGGDIDQNSPISAYLDAPQHSNLNTTRSGGQINIPLIKPESHYERFQKK